MTAYNFKMPWIAPTISL